MNFILAFALLLYLFYISKSYYEKSGNIQKLFVVLLFIVHFTAMGIAYRDTINFPDNDAFCFYKEALHADSWISLFGLGSSFLNFLIYPLVHAGLTLFVLFFLFATISYQTFLWYFIQMSGTYSNRIVDKAIPLIQCLFLLPSLHYWSGLLGKDVLVFFFLTYLVFQFKKETKIKGKHVLASLLLLLLRPHIFGATFIAFIIYFLTQQNISKSIKIKLSILLFAILAALVPVLMRFINITNLTYESISKKFFELNLYASQKGNSAVPLVDTSYVERIWLLLFRPLFNEAKTGYQYVISIENSIVMLAFILIGLYLYPKRKSITMEKEVKFAFLTGCCILVMIAVYIYNLGLASRMRLMFLPLLFYVLHQIVPIKNSEKWRIFPFANL